MKPWVVIPAYNEGKNIGPVLDNLLSYRYNILVVDDGSRDNTSKIVQSKGIKVIRHPINLGKGSALRTGCDYAHNCGAKIIVVMDADGQHDPKRIPDFIDAIEKNNHDMVFGYRSHWQRMPFVLRFGNWFINKSVSSLFGVKLRDTQSGFRAFKSSAYPKIRWHATDYFMESEMIAQMGKHKLNFTQVPIPTIYADKYKGTTVFDGVKIICKMVLHKIS